MLRNDFLERARDLSDQKLLNFVGRFALILWLASVPTRAASVLAAPREPVRHFIVLIDDSGDAGGFQHALPDVLPAYLFRNSQKGLPPFRPDRDHLTVAFFTIHSDGPSSLCKQVRRYSARPEYLFQLVDVDSG